MNSQSMAFQLSKAIRFESILRMGCFLFLVFWGLLQFWNNRFFEYYNDGISYLDMADYFRLGQWESGLSCFWNPLYPMLIAIIFKFLQPDAFHEFMMLKFVNLIVFLLMLIAFEYFLNIFVRFYNNQIQARHDLCHIERNTWILLAHGIFAYSFLCLNGIAADTPDMMSNLFMFLAFISALNIYCGHNSFKYYFMFGLFAGIAYLAKSAALLCMLACMLFVWQQSSRSAITRQRFIASVVILALFILSYSMYLSLRAGEFVLSPAAKLNYIWFVQDRTGIVFERDNRCAPMPLTHPVRQILTEPAVFEFAKPIGGTFPPWFDPSYWYAGYKIKMCPDWLFITGLCNLIYYVKILFFSLTSIAIAVNLFYKKAIASRDSLLSNSILFVPSMVGFLQYAFIINLSAVMPIFVNRYFGFYVILFALAALASLRIQKSKQGIRSFKLGTAIIGLCLCIILGQHFMEDFKNLFQRQYFEHYLMANELQKFGLREGDYVAKIGKEESLIDWARLARLKIVVDIPESKEFWSISSQMREEIFSMLKRYGIKMVVYCSAPISKQSKAWQEFEHLSFFERIGWMPKRNTFPNYQTPTPPSNENWYRINNLPCWVHKI